MNNNIRISLPLSSVSNAAGIAAISSASFALRSVSEKSSSRNVVSGFLGVVAFGGLWYILKEEERKDVRENEDP